MNRWPHPSILRLALPALLLLALLLAAWPWRVRSATSPASLNAYLPFVAEEYPAVLGDDFFRGCAMAHCEPGLSDHSLSNIPTGTVARIWGPHRAAGGSTYGLGCTSNSHIVACAYLTGLSVYTGAGHIQWEKDLGVATWTSAPIVTPLDTIVAASLGQLVHYDSQGNEMWRQDDFEGYAISPVILAPDPVLIIATSGGQLFAFDLWSGEQLAGPYDIEYVVGGRTYSCRIINTPGVRIDHRRFYVSTQCPGVTLDDISFLMAFNFNAESEEGFSRDWVYPYTGYSGASPTVIEDRIYFDGQPRLQPDAPTVFAVQDQTTHALELWRRTMDGPLQTSLAHDPRGGLWTFTLRWAEDDFAPHPAITRLDEWSGAPLQTLQADELIADDPAQPPPATPISIMTIAYHDGQPAMLVGIAVPLDENQPLCEVADEWLAAIDLNSGALLWKVRTPVFNPVTGTRHFFPTQFAFLVHPLDGRDVVVTAGACTGAIGISRLFVTP